MAGNQKQKKNTGKKPAAKEVTIRKSKSYKEIIAVILFAAGIFVILSLFGKAGTVGNLIRSILYGLFGQLTTVLLLAMLFVLSWRMLRGTMESLLRLHNCLLFAGFLLFLSALVYTFAYNAENTHYQSFGAVLEALWTSETGGIFGGGLSILLQKYVARPGAFVILTPATIICAMLLFSLSLVSFAKKTADAFTTSKAWVQKVHKRFRNDHPKKAKPASFSYGERSTGTKARTNIQSKAPEDPDEEDEDEDDVDFDLGSEEAEEIVFVSSDRKRRTQDVQEEAEQTAPFAQFGQSAESGAFADSDAENGLLRTETDGRMPACAPLKPSDTKAEVSLVTSQNAFHYDKPPFSLLNSVAEERGTHEKQRSYATKIAKKLEEVMLSFGIEAKVIHISRGPSVTRYELQPHSGVKVSRIKNLSDDIALNLAAPGIRIEAPIPGKAAIGIEIPNKEIRTVYLRDLIDSNAFLNHKSGLAFCLGEDISGEPVVADIAKMPHLLIAGATGSGKSVCINCLIISLLFKSSPNDVRLIMIDPKVVELGIYNGIPHLLIPVVTEPKKAAAALSWAVQEMENRYKSFAQQGIRDIVSYNAGAAERGYERLPRIVIIIDELADLMMVARDTVEDSINRIAQKARAAGIHLVVATQRPSVDVITGLIKSNIPSRIAFKVASQVDSRTILDYMGAEKLLGRGDLLFYPVGSMKAVRVQGGFVSDKEVEDVVDYLKATSGEVSYNESVNDEVNAAAAERGGKKGGFSSSDDELLIPAIEIAIETKQVSASYLQRRLGVGYSRAARLVDQMEAHGIISVKDGNNPRHVLVSEIPEDLLS